MAWVGIILLVIAGAIALVLSARADRRTKVPHDASEAAASTDEDAAEPEPIEGTEPEPADAEPATVSEPVAGTEPAPTSVGDEAVRARIAALAAELKVEGEPGPTPEAGPVTGQETTAQEAERVFAAVASVGRAAPGPEAAVEIEPEAEPEVERDVEPASEPESAGPSGVGHDHERPIANHSDLFAHVRAEHVGIATTGSTIQMRILHERAHAGQPADA